MYIASVSFGKDSLCMLLLILEYNLPLDEVVFYNTGMEFKCIYDIRDKVKILLEEKGIKFTELKPKRSFEDTMYNYPHKARNGEIKKGYGWCGGLCRWGTTEKTETIKKYVGNSHQYVGIAYDEQERLKRLEKNKSSPLADFGFTEKMALEYCYKHGWNWVENGIELYSILDRVSCWCCRNKNQKELRNYKDYLPEYWNKLVELENKIGEPMKKPRYLEDRFIDLFDNITE